MYATGGNSVIETGGKRIHIFTGSGTLTVTEAGDVDYLVVGGGGAGGTWVGGGGGGGGVKHGTLNITAGEKTITIGAGAPRGTNNSAGGDGNNSLLDDAGLQEILAHGGGGGAAQSTGHNGGSGGGGECYWSSAWIGGTGISGEGYGGGGGGYIYDVIAGGGGGASEQGDTDGYGFGGDGIEWPTGSGNYYGGGGGGWRNTNNTGIRPGGDGGGGQGGSAKDQGGNLCGEDGVVNTGGGGGGGHYANFALYGGAGGSGIVIVSYLLAIPDAPTPTDVEASIDDSEKVVLTWEKSENATGYKVYRDAVLIATLGDVDTYDDEDADAPVITPGTASASHGTSSVHVALSLSGSSIANGTEHEYTVIAFNDGGDSEESDPAYGYCVAGTVTYQWQRSAGESDASYSDINGATTASYNDTTAPSNGDIRFYKCKLNATGSVQVLSTFNPGYREKESADYPDPANVLPIDTTDGVPGTLDISAYETAAAAAQLVIDKAAVNTAKSSIKNNATILTIQGTYDFAAAIAAGYSSGESAQLSADQAEVLANVAYIVNTATILGQAGTLDMALYLLKSLLPDKKYLYCNIDRGDGQKGTLRASNLHTNAGAPGVDLSASIIKKDVIVDDITGTLEEGGGRPEFKGANL